MMTATNCIKRAKVQDIRLASTKDDTLQQLCTVITEGWPVTKQELSPSLIPYFQFRDQLVIQEGDAYRGNQCLIPKTLRTYTLKRIHQAHIGAEGCIRRAKDSVFCPGMTTAIRDYVSKCEVCQMYQSTQSKEPL